MARLLDWLRRKPRHVHIIRWYVLLDEYADGEDLYRVRCVCTADDCPRDGVPYFDAVVSDDSWPVRLQWAFDGDQISAGAYYGAPIAPLRPYVGR